tara:strand:- start:11868 stop:12431 length:564 start_codon:yes stop_codon:yes gene_type:complete
LNHKKIVITGGPSTGKTSVIQQLEQQGFLCMEEVVRKMTADKLFEEDAEAFTTNPIISVPDPLQFNLNLLEQRIAQYRFAADSKEAIVFFDRGIPDVMGYMQCFGQQYGDIFERAGKEIVYDLVFLMPPWQEIHTVDTERFESFEESLQIDACLAKVYSDFGYNPIIVPKISVAGRVAFILDWINKT